jgi:hypothetical protein
MGLTPATGYSDCPAGQQLRLDSFVIISTQGGNSFMPEILDYSYNSGPTATNSYVSLHPSTATTTGCYRLMLPYQFKGSAQAFYVKCTSGGTCQWRVQSSVTCVETASLLPANSKQCLAGPSPTAPASFGGTLPDPCSNGNPSTITSNDKMHYCCNTTSITPVFGTGGFCTCTTRKFFGCSLVRALSLHAFADTLMISLYYLLGRLRVVLN